MSKKESLEKSWNSLSKTFDELLRVFSKNVSKPSFEENLEVSADHISPSVQGVSAIEKDFSSRHATHATQDTLVTEQLNTVHEATTSPLDPALVAAQLDVLLSSPAPLPSEPSDDVDLQEVGNFPSSLKEETSVAKEQEELGVNEEEEMDFSALGSDWQFLMEADLGDASDDVEETPDAIIASILREDVVVDKINVKMLADVVGEMDDLVADIDMLLSRVDKGDKEDIRELHRKVHTLKGNVGQVGALRARAVIHHMETLMEEVVEGRHAIQSKKQELLVFFDQAKKLIEVVRNTPWAENGNETSGITQAVQAPKVVRIAAESIDKMVADINESRLAGLAIEEFFVSSKNKLKDLEENALRASRMLREVELQAEIQIQSRRSQLQEMGEDFDPLEFDRFTRLQELSRLANESIVDILEVRRDLSRVSVEQEATIARQRRSILSAQEQLHKTRLVPVDAINDRLYTVVWESAREVGKNISFEMSGARTELDRVLLEKIIPPLEHILRNSVVHGIEDPDLRRQLGKEERGTISVGFRQEAGRALIEITDDGYGLRVDKIKEKAVEKGLWKASQPMNDQEAAEMICAPGFSTADAVSNLAGRGVGMDVVRNNILNLGGKFEIVSRPQKGLLITVQLPTSIASASVLVVESGGENWAFPIEMVEHVVLLSKKDIAYAREQKIFPPEKGLEKWAGVSFDFLEDFTGVRSPSSIRQDSAPVLLLKERGRQMAVEVSRLVQVFEVPLRPAGPIWGAVKGVAGTVILPNGDAIFLVDPFRFVQASQDHAALDVDIVSPPTKSAPLVMVVDDSLTVRKASVRFLHKHGFESVTAKDGQEALDLLMRIQPSVILMDIEMPKMDGFDCTKNIRENPKHAQTPIIMITSRTADKHRQRAQELGVNDYLGKPFKDDELLGLLQHYTQNR